MTADVEVAPAAAIILSPTILFIFSIWSDCFFLVILLVLQLEDAMVTLSPEFGSEGCFLFELPLWLLTDYFRGKSFVAV